LVCEEKRMNKSGGGEMSKWPFTISKYLSILAGAGLGSRERTFSSSQKIRVEDICGLTCK